MAGGDLTRSLGLSGRSHQVPTALSALLKRQLVPLSPRPKKAALGNLGEGVRGGEGERFHFLSSSGADSSDSSFRGTNFILRETDRLSFISFHEYLWLFSLLLPQPWPGHKVPTHTQPSEPRYGCAEAACLRPGRRATGWRCYLVNNDEEPSQPLELLGSAE